MRGLPGSGKSTVAQQLGKDGGKIFTLDKTIVENKKNLIAD
jgi:adenylate kinase family enzyme